MTSSECSLPILADIKSENRGNKKALKKTKGLRIVQPHPREYQPPLTHSCEIATTKQQTSLKMQDTASLGKAWNPLTWIYKIGQTRIAGSRRRLLRSILRQFRPRFLLHLVQQLIGNRFYIRCIHFWDKLKPNHKAKTFSLTCRTQTSFARYRCMCKPFQNDNAMPALQASNSKTSAGLILVSLSICSDGAGFTLLAKLRRSDRHLTFSYPWTFAFRKNQIRDVAGKSKKKNYIKKKKNGMV